MDERHEKWDIDPGYSRSAAFGLIGLLPLAAGHPFQKEVSVEASKNGLHPCDRGEHGE